MGPTDETAELLNRACRGERAETLCRNYFRSVSGRTWASRLGYGKSVHWQSAVWSAVLFREANRLLAEPPAAAP